MNLEEYLSGLQLEHFSPKELMFLGNRNVKLKLNDLPPDHLWENIVKTAWIADLARGKIGAPITVISAYRNEAYNTAIKGADRSLHMSYMALDLQCSKNLELYDLLLSWRSHGLFKGGLGFYSSFTHLDTRGTNSTWSS